MNQELYRMQMLAGIITEGQYKSILNEDPLVNDNLLDLVNLLNRVKEETKTDEKGNKFNRLEWELNSLGDYEEKFHIFHDDSTDITLVAGNGLLLSTNENDIETQSEEMELYDPRIGKGYYEVEIDDTLIYYIMDPNA